MNVKFKKKIPDHWLNQVLILLLIILGYKQQQNPNQWFEKK